MTDQAPINLIVLFGGQSAEHDVSRVTATHVLAAVDQTRYNVMPIAITREGQWLVADDAIASLRSGRLPTALDVVGTPTSMTPVLAQAAHAVTVVLPLLHGPCGEDGTVQGALELAGVPYVGCGVLSSALAMDKAAAKEILAHHGIPQARWRSFAEHQITESLVSELVTELGLPMFIKPANMGSSVGVTKAHDPAEVHTAIEFALTYDEWIVAEEAIVGREIEVAILGNLDPQASVPGEVRAGREFYDYEDKYHSDAAQLLIPAPLSGAETIEVQALALRAFRALRCDGMARADFFYEEGGRGFLCNELNTIPGFTPISMYPKMWQASGLAYSDLIDRLVSLALERHQRRRRNTAH